MANFDQHEEAHKAAFNSTEIYRRLADAQPDVFLPDLARSLNTLGALPSKIGRSRDPLGVAREATEYIAGSPPNVPTRSCPTWPCR